MPALLRARNPISWHLDTGISASQRKQKTMFDNQYTYSEDREEVSVSGLNACRLQSIGEIGWMWADW